MKLWILELNGNLKDYDCNYGHVIRASTEKKARKIASKISGAEDEKGPNGSNPWLDPNSSTCKELFVDGEEEVILTDFCAG